MKRFLFFFLLTTPAFADPIEDSCIAAAVDGQKQRKAGQLKDAKATFGGCAKIECPKEIGEKCTAWLGELESVIPSLVVSVQDENGQDILDAEVRIDGVVQDMRSGKAVEVDPGIHAIEAAGVKQEVVVREGERTRLIESLRIGETTLALDRADVPAAPASTATRFGRIVGSSPEMRRIYPLCDTLAASDVPVVIEGETGTGKEVLAESFHEASPRKDQPFVVFDCTAVPASLMESELFGHERGAFTGATATRKGVFEQAHGGTLLIDEIGELDATLQPKLLRAIERSEVRRVGGDKWIKVNVRVLAATRRDLDREVQDGRFRDDLFFRLAVGRVELPALRNRRGDIRILAQYFWGELGGKGRLPYEVEQRFERHTWPGNVRELRNTIARHLALGDLEAASTEAAPAPAPIEAGTGPDAIDAILAQNLPFPRARRLVLAELERRYTERLLQHHGGSVAKAAEASGIARRYFNIILARGKK